MTHRILQLDGHSGLADEDSNFEWYLCPLCYNEDTYFASEKGLCTHIMDNHEPCDVFHTFGKDWVSEQMQCTKRNLLRNWENFLDQECQCKECKEKQSHKHIEYGWSPWV